VVRETPVQTTNELRVGLRVEMGLGLEMHVMMQSSVQ
jgi:hypothetical protein